MSDPRDRRLPVPVPGTVRGGRAAGATSPGCAVFRAQVEGQGGARRGLRGGPPALAEAHAAYRTTEWSGPADRRARLGGVERAVV